MVIVLMGVAGSGKTTLGTRVAAELGWLFADADDYHPAANVEKMRKGIPLTDADRAPWLATLRELIMRWIAEGQNAMLACSALKREYRDELRTGPEVRFLYLKAAPEVLRERLRARSGHYMKAGMLESQLATLEQPKDAMVVDVSGTVEDSVRAILAKVRTAKE
jgi:gluconokinase